MNMLIPTTRSTPMANPRRIGIIPVLPADAFPYTFTSDDDPCPVLIHRNWTIDLELKAHMSPDIIPIFNTATDEQKEQWVKIAKANQRIGFKYQPLEQPEYRPLAHCESCTHLIRSVVKPTGGLASCNKHPHHIQQHPTARRLCRDYRPTLVNVGAC